MDRCHYMGYDAVQTVDNYFPMNYVFDTAVEALHSNPFLQVAYFRVTKTIMVSLLHFKSSRQNKKLTIS